MDRSRSPLRRERSDDFDDSSTLDLETCLPRRHLYADNIYAFQSFGGDTGASLECSARMDDDEEALLGLLGLTERTKEPPSVSAAAGQAEAEAEPQFGERPSFFQSGLQPPDVDVSSHTQKTLLCWLQPMLAFFQPLFEKVQWKRKVKLSTMCSGTGAPRIALKYLGVPIEECSSADPKPSCMEMCRALDQLPQHHWRFAVDHGNNQGYCLVHEKHCQGSPEPDDLSITGFPCQPFSSQRPFRFQDGNWEQHPATETMYEVASAIRKRQHRLVVLENVAGFLLQTRQEHSRPKRSQFCTKYAAGSPLDMLLRGVNGFSYNIDETPDEELREDQLTYFWHVQCIDAALWLRVPRERAFILLVHKDLGRAVLEKAIQTMEKAMEFCEEQRNIIHADDLMLPDSSQYVCDKFAEMQVSKSRCRTGEKGKGQGKWQAQSRALRQELPEDIRHLRPWSLKARMQGLSKSDRVCESLDLAFLFSWAARREAGLPCDDDSIVTDLFCDTSQALQRKPWGRMRTLCTSSACYSFSRDRLLLPCEALRSLGFGDCSFTDSLSSAEITDVAGCGMALPSAALPAMSLLLAAHDRLQIPDLFDHWSPGHGHGPHLQ